MNCVIAGEFIIANAASTASTADSCQPLAPGQRLAAWGINMHIKTRAAKIARSTIDTWRSLIPFKPNMPCQTSDISCQLDSLNGTQANETARNVTGIAIVFGKLIPGISNCLKW